MDSEEASEIDYANPMYESDPVYDDFLEDSDDYSGLSKAEQDEQYKVKLSNTRV